MIDHIAELVSQKATEIAHEEIANYSTSHPEVTLKEDTKKLCVERSITQLSFKLNSFKSATAESEDSVDELFEDWFSKNEEEDLRTTCRHCLDSEVKKIAKDDDPNLSWLDRFRRDHRRR